MISIFQTLNFLIISWNFSTEIYIENPVKKAGQNHARLCQESSLIVIKTLSTKTDKEKLGKSDLHKSTDAHFTDAFCLINSFFVFLYFLGFCLTWICLQKKITEAGFVIPPNQILLIMQNWQNLIKKSLFFDHSRFARLTQFCRIFFFLGYECF